MTLAKPASRVAPVDGQRSDPGRLTWTRWSTMPRVRRMAAAARKNGGSAGNMVRPRTCRADVAVTRAAPKVRIAHSAPWQEVEIDLRLKQVMVPPVCRE